MKYFPLIIFLLCFSCKKESKTNVAMMNTLQARANAEEKSIDFTTVTQFKWDSLLFLNPYSPTPQIEGLQQFGERKEGHSQVIFFNNGKPTESLDYPLYIGEFYEKASLFIKSKDAKFDVTITADLTSDGKRWLKLRKK